MRLDFICPGMAKCGTTTLHDILSQHTHICLPSPIKEPLWLNYYDTCTNKGVDWYAEHYYGISKECPQKDNVLYGEINPSFGVTSARRLHEFFAGCKIIFLFRDPVERLWSHFNMNFRKYSVMQSSSAEKMLHACESSAQAFSLFCNENFERIGNRIKYTGGFNHVLSRFGYAFYCKTYLRFFEKEHIKVILFEDFIKNPKEVCEDLFEFLEVVGGDKIDYSIKSNEGKYNTVSEKEHKLLVDLERQRVESMVNGTVEEMRQIRRKIGLANKRINSSAPNTIKERLSQECAEMLQEYFSDDKKYIEEYLQRDLSDIWY